MASLVVSILAFVRELMDFTPTTDYGVGYMQALKDVEEYTTTKMWEEGEEDDG